MWLHLPISACSPGAEDSTSPSESLFLALAASVSSSGKLAQPASWRRAWKMGALKRLRFGPTSDPSLADSFIIAWLESLGAFPAPTSASPGNKPESTESTVGCGLNTSESFAKCSPNGSLLKTSPQSSLFQQEESYSEGLPKAGSMRSGYLFERPTWAHRTAAKESLSSHGIAGGGGSGMAYPEHSRSSCAGSEGGTSAAAANFSGPSEFDVEDTTRDGGHGSHGESGRRRRVCEAGDELAVSTLGGLAGVRKSSRSDGLAGGGVARLWTTPQTHDIGARKAERVGRYGTEHGGRNLTDDVMLWRSPGAGSPNSLRGSCQSGVRRAEQGHQVNLADQVGDWLEDE